MDKLQPIDLSVIRSAKEVKKFSEWYAEEVKKQLYTGVSTSVDLKCPP